MDLAAWDLYAGGSDDEVTLRANCTAFERIRLRPRVLVDVNVCDLRTTVLGTPVNMPILVAPTGYHGLAHPEAECATARAAGYRAVVVTVDLPRLGHREKNIRNKFALPPHLQEGNFTANTDLSEKSSLLTWDVLPWLRSITTLPILLKGILTAEDAKLAVEHGVEGIVVSNHGGRQLDTALASIEALPEVIEAVAGRCEIYLDGGIRRGTDILKALALGARAVL